MCAECSDDCTKGSLNRYLDSPSCHTYMQFWWLIYSTSWHGELFIYWFLNMLDSFTFFQSYSWSNTVYGNMLCSCFHSDARSCLTFDPCVGWSLTFSQHVIKSTTFCAAHRRNWTTETFPKRMESSGLYIFNWIDLQFFVKLMVGVLMKETGVPITQGLPSGLSHGGLERTQILNFWVRISSSIPTKSKITSIQSTKESLHPQERTAKTAKVVVV